MNQNNNLDMLLCKSQPPVRQRRQRTNFSEEVIEKLEEFFLKNPYPDINEREQMAKLLNTNEDRVQVWFQNKRARYRKRVQKENNHTAEPSKITRKNKVNLDKTPEPVKTTNDSGYSSFSFQSPCLADISFNYNPTTHPIYNHYNQSTPNALSYHMYLYNQMSPVVYPAHHPNVQPRHNQTTKFFRPFE